MKWSRAFSAMCVLAFLIIPSAWGLAEEDGSAWVHVVRGALEEEEVEGEETAATGDIHAEGEEP